MKLFSATFLLLSLCQALPRSNSRPVVRDYSDTYDPVSQFRIAYNGGKGVTVSWSSANQIQNPVVWYGEDTKHLKQSSVGTSTTYPTAVTWDNHVIIDNLK